MAKRTSLSFIDLFCGIGGFRVVAEMVCEERNLVPKCLFSCDIDPEAQESYVSAFSLLGFGTYAISSGQEGVYQ